MTDETEVSDKTVAFRYARSRMHRSVHVDGAIGGINGRGQLNISLYSERVPLPEGTVATVDGDGNLVEEFLAEPLETLLREVELTVILDLQTAEELHDWLSERIFDLRRLKDNVSRQSAAE